MLKLGKMTGREIAEWFGVAYGTYKRRAEAYKEKLKPYAEFTEYRGGIEITRIINPQVSEYNQSARQLVREKAPEYWPPNTWNSGSNVGSQIYNDYSTLQNKVQPQTVVGYVNEWKRDGYGIPYKRHGSLGDCVSSYIKAVKQEDGSILYVELTEEEKAIKSKIIKKYFGTDEEKELIIHEAVRDGEMTKEEAYDALKQLKGYSSENIAAFKAELAAALGPIGKATYIVPGYHFEEG